VTVEAGPGREGHPRNTARRTVLPACEAVYTSKDPRALGKTRVRRLAGLPPRAGRGRSPRRKIECFSRKDLPDGDAPNPAKASRDGDHGVGGRHRRRSRPASTFRASGGQSAEELARKLSNPVSAMISLPFQRNVEWSIGGARRLSLDDECPTSPLELSRSRNLIIRTIMPIIQQRDVVVGAGSQSGLGDIMQSFFLSPRPNRPRRQVLRREARERSGLGHMLRRHAADSELRGCRNADCRSETTRRRSRARLSPWSRLASAPPQTSWRN
jgi:hypothetical protein